MTRLSTYRGQVGRTRQIMPRRRDRAYRSPSAWRLTAGQATGIGMSPSTLASRVRAGDLHRVHRGIYAIGHPALSERGKWMAAVLACGEGAVLSHMNAAELWEIRRPRRPSLSDAHGELSPVH